MSTDGEILAIRQAREVAGMVVRQNVAAQIRGLLIEKFGQHWETACIEAHPVPGEDITIWSAMVCVKIGKVGRWPRRKRQAVVQNVIVVEYDDELMVLRREGDSNGNV